MASKSAAGGRVENVGALGAYHKRQADSSSQGDLGTITEGMQAARERAEAERAEAKYRDKHAFVGEHYNDI